MQPAELNHEVHDEELLATVRDFNNWKAELAGSPLSIDIIADHRAL